MDIFHEHCSNLLLFHMVEELNPLSLQIACLPLNGERKLLSENVNEANMIFSAKLWLIECLLLKNCRKINASVQEKRFRNALLRAEGLTVEITSLSWFHRFRKTPFSKRFSSTRKRKPGFFKFLLLEERFGKVPFSWRIIVDGRLTRRNKATISNFSGEV